VLLNTGLYKLLLVAHIFCAIVGFGSTYLNAIYGAEIRKRRGPEGYAVYQANFRVSEIGQLFIYGVFVFGLGLAFYARDKGALTFGTTWVWLAIVLYLVGISVSHGVLVPSVRRMGKLMKEMIDAGPPPAGAAGPPPQAAQMAALGQRVAASGAFLNVLIVAVLVLMVWRPGQ